MQYGNNIDNMLREQLSLENSGIFPPDPLLVFEARQAVMRRKPRLYKLPAELFSFIQFLKGGLRPYQLGFSALAFVAATFWISELSPDYSGHSGFSEYSAVAFSISERTISVTSSTMLTSIPTLVIRN